MQRSFRDIFKSWWLITIVCFVALSTFQYYVVYPIEAALFPNFPTYVSILFLPHAVRVLSTVILGPKAFFALLPAVMVSQHLYYIATDGSWDYASFAFVFVGAASAPVAYFLMKHFFDHRIDYQAALMNWRFVFLVGIITSAINSIGLSTLLLNLRHIGEIVEFIPRFFIGDLAGLFVGLVTMVLLFRALGKLG